MLSSTWIRKKLAQAAFSESRNIEDISSSIPLAMEAPLYSYTEVAEKYSFDGFGYWHTELFDISPPTSYSVNTGSRSVDVGTSVYKVEFASATSSSRRSRNRTTTSSTSTLQSSTSNKEASSKASSGASQTSRSSNESNVSSDTSPGNTSTIVAISATSASRASSAASSSSQAASTSQPPRSSALNDVASSSTHLSFVLLLLSVFLVF